MNLRVPVQQMTKRRGRVVSTSASYSGGPGFKSRPADMLSRLRIFVVFLGPSMQMLEYCRYIKLGHDRFLPYSFQLIHH
jgi:hypothetical protein